MVRRHSRDAVTSRLRLRDFDYSAPGAFAITICTRKRACLFGTIQRGEVRLSHAGVVIDSWWRSIPNHFPDVTLDAMIVMPNHLHGVLITGTEGETVSPLSEVIGWFKSYTVRDYGIGVGLEDWPRYDGHLWQDGYYDHIIRDDADLDRIRRYIDANPSMWMDDEYYIEVDD